jgi:hypothetical protein
MDQPAQQDLFEVKLSPSGKLYIRKFEAAARILIIIGSVIALIFIAETIIRAVKINPEIYAGNRLLLFHTGYYLFIQQSMSFFFFYSCIITGK